MSFASGLFINELINFSFFFYCDTVFKCTIMNVKEHEIVVYGIMILVSL